MEYLENIKDKLIELVQEQTEHFDCMNAQELGAVIDMIKDLDEAIYYHTITETMHTKNEIIS